MRSASSKAKLTLWVSIDAKTFGKGFAKSRHESLSRLVSEYLSRLREAENLPAEVTPIVSRLSGIIRGKGANPLDYRRYLEKKYSDA